MAPALTQASDPQTFHVATHHHSPAHPDEAPVVHSSSSPTTHLALQYGGLKEPPDCTDAHLTAALTNGKRRVRLLPSSPPEAVGLACGREGSDPPPRPHATHSTMDLPSGVSSPQTQVKSSNHNSETTMGQDTVLQGTESAPAQVPASKSQRLGSQDDLLSLIGKDFASMSEIIDTLTRLADNPEVLAAVDMAVNSDQHNIQPQVAAPQVLSKEERSQLLLSDLSRRQWQIERRRSRLLRRLRRVTARGLGATVSGQMRELLDHCQSVFALNNQKCGTPATIESLRADTMKSMSTSALVSLVRRVEASQGLGLSSGSHRHHPVAPVSVLPSDARTEVGAVVTELQAASNVHTHHDSDATESSSGGESCDEMDGFNNSHIHYSALRERSFYRYCRTRSWVASRWTWLQAQIADLEYRILQQHKIYTHVRNTKGAVQVEEDKWRGINKRDPAHLDVHDPALTCLTTPIRTTVNGYHGRVEDSTIADSSYTSARTQGLRGIKRRRLVRAGAGLCTSHRRGGGGGRIPAVQCKCVPPLTCVLCTRLQGTVPPVAPPDPDTQSARERHARVDPSFHPVLTQRSDISLSDQFDILLKCQTDWQKHSTSKTIQPVVIPRTNNREVPPPGKKPKRDRKKENKKSKKEGKGRIMLKIKKSSISTGDLVKEADLRRKRLSAQEALSMIKKVKAEEDDDNSSVYGSLHSSPSASPAPIDRSAHKRHSTNSNNKKQNSSGSSYDINNIVIPYSMVATTRVEKLEYKEIPTPKWRIVSLDSFSSPVSSTSQEEEEEDVSEEAVVGRHNRSEELERKKFFKYLQTHVSSRSRSRRTDSSGTNTPDHPSSPHPPDVASETASPLATPPCTPLAPSEDSNPSLPAASNNSGITSSTSTLLPSSTVNVMPDNENSQASYPNQPSTLLVHYPQGGMSNDSLPPNNSNSNNASPAFSRSLFTLQRERTYRRISITEDGYVEKEVEGIDPYEKRVFPLHDVDYASMVRENENCDINPLSKFFDPSNSQTNMANESGRSSPVSEVTDSAPEDDGNFDDMAEPKWTISGLKDATTGQCVLQVQRN